MRFLKYCSVLLPLALTGCTTVVQQSTALWGVMTFKEDPVPVYVSPMVYEDKNCDTLGDYHYILGKFADALNQQMSRRMKDIAVPEDKKVSQWPDGARYVKQHNLPIDINSTWYEAFVTSWGHYEALHKAQLNQQCGLNDRHGLLPWQNAQFDW